MIVFQLRLKKIPRRGLLGPADLWAYGEEGPQTHILNHSNLRFSRVFALQSPMNIVTSLPQGFFVILQITEVLPARPRWPFVVVSGVVSVTVYILYDALGSVRLRDGWLYKLQIYSKFQKRVESALYWLKDTPPRAIFDSSLIPDVSS